MTDEAKKTSSYQTASLEYDRSLVSQFVSMPERVVRESLESSALTLDAFAQQMIAYAESSSENARRVLCDRRRLISKDAWGDLLKADVKNWVEPVTAAAVMGANHQQVDISKNPFRDICKELAVLYKEPPIRTTQGSKAGEQYKKLLEGTNLDLFWSQVDEALEVYNDVIIYPVVVERAGKKIIKHRWAAGNVVTVLLDEDDPTTPIAYLFCDTYYDIKGNERTKYVLWTENWHAVYSDDGSRLDVGDNPGVNPYAPEMMFVPIHRYASDDCFWDQTSGEDLINLTLNTGKLRTFTNYEWKMSCFKQLALVGQNIDSQPVQLRDPCSTLVFEADAQLHVVDWTSNFTMRREYIEADLAQAAATRGINPDRMRRKGNYNTSQAVRMADAGLIERRQAKAPIFQAAEQAYYRKVCLLARHHDLDIQPDPDAILDVQHSPLRLPEDPKGDLEYSEFATRLGVESPLELIRRQHPSWTMEQCRQHMQENLKVAAEIMAWRARNNIPADLRNESLTAEQNGRLGPLVRDNRQPPSSSSPGETDVRENGEE